MAVPSSFTREMGCTPAELVGWLPGASRERPIRLSPSSAEVQIDSGRLNLRWHQLEHRRIALITLPRLSVSFEFADVGDEQRREFMRYFDLYTQRGGG